MNHEHSRAVSFANSYFTLVDGLASELEDYLADDVILDWFGRTIRGKTNVHTFMKVHKVNSRHIFNKIVPTESIGYRKYNLNRKIINLLSNAKQDSSQNAENSLDSLQTTDIEGNHLKEEGASYELSDNDLNVLGKLEITSTSPNEIKWNIEKMKTFKVEGEIMGTKSKKEFGQGDGPMETEIQTKKVKFVEATGKMHLWMKHKGADVYDTIPLSHIWKRACKLQIAYSLIKSESLDNSTNLNTDHQLKSATSEFQTKRLPTFEDISELSSRLVPNINNFGGYFRQMNFSEDRDNFLKSLGAELAVSESRFPRFVPQYVGNRLVFRRRNFEGCDESNFVFKYKIHMIVYKGNSRCKLNLLKKFD